MEAVSRMASPKQIEFLADLIDRTETRFDRALESLTLEEASGMIDELLEKEDPSSPQNVKTVVRRKWKDERTMQARLGMAFKLVYQASVVRSDGCVQRPSIENNEFFAKEVIRVFESMNEIAEQVGVDGGASV